MSSEDAFGPVLNTVDALASVGGDDGLLAELVEIFVLESPTVLAEIHRCVVAEDSRGLQQVAHRLRGSLSVFGAHAIANTALALETMGREGRLTGATATLATLQRQLEQLDRELSALRGAAA